MSISPAIGIEEEPTEEDAKNCYNYMWKYNLQVTLYTSCFGNNNPFHDEDIQRHYENFRIKSVLRVHSLFWIAQLFLFLIGFCHALESDFIFIRVLMGARVAVVLTALYNFFKIFCARVTNYENRDDFHRFVSSVTQLSNFVIVGSAVVNGAVYVWMSSLGSCLEFDDEDPSSPDVEAHSLYFACNTSYEIGGTPMHPMILLVLGNIFTIITLRCHRSWAARVSYLTTCMCVIAAAVVSPRSGQSSLVFLCAVLTVLIYEDLEHSSLAMFKALLDLESTKRVQMRELKHFIGNVAHDLKTPLCGFSMCMGRLMQDLNEVLPDCSQTELILQTMELCKANCSFMSTAINRTVDFTKGASNIALNARTDVVSLKNAIQWAMTCQSTQTRIPIRLLPIPSGICDTISTDKHWLMENILCYLSNAAKYSSGGKITIRVSIQDDEEIDEFHSTAPSNNVSISRFSFGGRASGSEIYADTSEVEAPSRRMLCIEVEDQGIGVDEEKKSTLFKPFQQTMRLAGGTGLGLYSLSKRIQVLKGKYGVTNRIDGSAGSRFWFTIPYNPLENYQEEESSTMLWGSSKRMAMFMNESVDSIDKEDESISSESFMDSDIHALVVEDSVVISKATALMLSSAGYTVHLAENGAAGLEKMKKRHFSLVLMDLQMPIMDGLEATRRMRAYENELASSGTPQRPRQYIIGTSANQKHEVIDVINACGMDDFLSKPYTINDLQELKLDVVPVFEDNNV